MIGRGFTERRALDLMSSTNTASTEALTEVFRRTGNWSEVYVDVSTDSGFGAQLCPLATTTAA